MALKLKCPCGERLSAPESAAGKRGRCSKCGKTFIIPGPKAVTPAASPPASQHVADDGPDLSDLGGDLPDLGDDFGDLLDDALSEPTLAANLGVTNPFASPTTAPEPVSASKGSRGTRNQMNTLANGIKLVFWGTVLVVVAVLISFFAGLFLPAMVLVALGVSLIGSLISTIGRIVCLGGPSKTGGKSLLIAAVACDLISIGVALATMIGAAIAMSELVINLLGLATLILFVLFIRAVTSAIGQSHLAEDARTIVILVATAIVLLVATPFVALIFPLLPLVTVVSFIGVGLAAVFKYLNLLQYTAEAVRP